MSNQHPTEGQITFAGEVNHAVNLDISPQEAVDSVVTLSQQTVDFLSDPARETQPGQWGTLENMTDDQLKAVLDAAYPAKEVAESEVRSWDDTIRSARNALSRREDTRKHEAAKESHEQWEADHPEEMAQYDEWLNSRRHRAAQSVRRVLGGPGSGKRLEAWAHPKYRAGSDRNRQE